MIEHDAGLGQITDDEIRYVTLRADVLMHLSDHLPNISTQAFLTALEKSVYQYASGSFEHYKAKGAGDLDALLRRCSEAASQLGWGLWRTSVSEHGDVLVVVENSPFAAGFGSSVTPVCSAISGALRAVFSVHGEPDVSVSELKCFAQGATPCHFHVSRKP